jgi:hypothetical protein
MEVWKMKRILFAILLIVGLTLVSAFAFHRGGGKQVNIVVHVKDLSQEGLTLITPGHPEFEARFAEYSHGKSSADASARKSFTALFQVDLSRLRYRRGKKILFVISHGFA